MIRTDPVVQDGWTQESLKGVEEDEAGKGSCNYQIDLECYTVCTLVCRPVILQLWHKELQRRHYWHLELDNSFEGGCFSYCRITNNILDLYLLLDDNTGNQKCLQTLSNIPTCSNIPNYPNIIVKYPHCPRGTWQGLGAFIRHVVNMVVLSKAVLIKGKSFKTLFVY